MDLKKGLIIFFGAILFLGALFCFGYFPRDSFILGIKQGGINLGGLSLERAQEKLSSVIEDYLRKKIKFLYLKNGKEIEKEISLKEIGLNFDIQSSLKEIFEFGKKGNFFENLKIKFKALFGKYNFPLDPFFSEGNELENFIGSNFGQYETLPQNAQIIFNEALLDFEIIQERPGKVFSSEKIKEEIKKEARFLNLKNIVLFLESKEPQIKSEGLKAPLFEARKVLEIAPIKLKANGQNIFAKKETLGKWLDFSLEKKGNEIFYKLDLNQEMIHDYLLGISEKVNVLARNPILNFKDGEIKIVSPPKKGKMLDIKKSSEIIREKILLNKKEIRLSFKEVDPEITEDKIKDLKIEKLIGKGISNFRGSPGNRIHNIKLSSSKLSGILIKPQEVFSFNKTLGPVGPEGGYLPELVIKPRKTIPEYGGGVCQVSTTLFRAAVNSGLEITERHPHSYPVRYYGKPGFDATVYYPFPDLKFKNNTPGYILIQSKIEKNSLIFEIYGQDDKREVKIKGPFVIEVKKNGSIKTRLDQEVYKEGNLILRKSFFSNYKPPGVFPVVSQ